MRRAIARATLRCRRRQSGASPEDVSQLDSHSGLVRTECASKLTVTIRGNGRVLPHRLQHRVEAQLVPGVVVEHKHLDGVFAWIAAQQCDRDAACLANPKITLRAQENQQLGIPRAVARGFSPRLLELVGCGVYNGLVGHIDKQGPEGAARRRRGTPDGVGLRNRPGVRARA